MSVKQISILMPVRNAAKYLPECLDSIRQQSTEDWELIAINDHSTDASKAILSSYANDDKRIQTLDNQGEGIICALRLAYAHSTGMYITRMDADDLMPPEKLAVLRELLEQNGRGNVATGKVKYFAEGGIKDGYRKYENWLNRLTETASNFTDIYKECVIPSPCWMLHRADFEACNAFRPNRYPEDYDLCFRMYQAGFKVAASHKILHHWRDHGTRASRNDDNYADNRFLEIKLHYFLKLERKKTRPLVLWGAGKKGKNIAQQLTSKGIDFHWVCNNDRKIGVNIYGKILTSPDLIFTLKKPQIIVTVANESDQKMIISRLTASNFEKARDYYLFC